MPTKPKYKIEEVRRRLEDIRDRENICYEELMARDNRRDGLMIEWASWRFKVDLNDWKLLMEVKRKALKISMLEVYGDCGTAPNYAEFQKKHPQLEGAVRVSYPSEDGRSYYDFFVEDCGLLSSKKQRSRGLSLKEMLEGLSKFGENPEDFDTSVIKVEDGGLITALYYTFRGGVGKGVILLGINYLEKSNIQPTKRSTGAKRKRYSFSEEDLDRIIKDGSLTDDEKAACLFNAFSLQYYDYEESGFPVIRNIGSRTFTNQVIQRRAYYGNRMGIALESGISPDGDFKTAIVLAEGIPNRFNCCEFYFPGSFGINNSSRFYSELEERLNKCFRKQ